MRTYLAPLLAVAVLSWQPVLVFGQDAPEPLPDPAETAGESDTTLPQETDAMSLIPQDTEPLKAEDYSEIDAEVPAFEEIPIPAEEEAPIHENKEAKALDNRIRLFETRVKARNDPAVQAELLRAQTVRTFPEERDALFNYYTLLYARMRKLAPDLEEMILENRNRDFQRLKQSQIKPSVWPVAPPLFPPTGKWEAANENAD